MVGQGSSHSSSLQLGNTSSAVKPLVLDPDVLHFLGESMSTNGGSCSICASTTSPNMQLAKIQDKMTLKMSWASFLFRCSFPVCWPSSLITAQLQLITEESPSGPNVLKPSFNPAREWHDLRFPSAAHMNSSDDGEWLKGWCSVSQLCH